VFQDLAARGAGSLPLTTTSAATLDGAPMHALGRVTLRYPPTPCDGYPGLSVLPSGIPTVGQPWTCSWDSVPTVPPDPPPAEFALLVSFRAVEPAPLPGRDGCWLMVAPDHVLVPAAGGILRRTGAGSCELSITWPPSAIGTSVVLQMLAADTAAGLHTRVSPMLWLVVGSG